MLTRLILIRHGSTEWNLRHRYCGDKDVGLNAKGREQARRLRDRLRQERIDKVYCSDRSRALATCRIIFKDKRPQVFRQLREINFGVFEGLTHKEILQRYAYAYKRWLKDPFRHPIPQGERLKDFQERIISVFKKLVLKNKDRQIAVVSHGGVISIFLNHIEKRKDFWKQIPHPASLSIIEYENGKAKIKLFDDLSHLAPSRKTRQNFL
jgi:broad specificity phosphatase PhoE